MSIQTRFKTVGEEIPDAPEQYRDKLYFGSFDPLNPFDKADIKTLTAIIKIAGMQELAGFLQRERWHLLLEPKVAIVALLTPLYEILARGEPLDAEARQEEANNFIATAWAGAMLIERIGLLREAQEPTKHVLELDAPPGVSALIYRKIGELD